PAALAIYSLSLHDALPIFDCHGREIDAMSEFDSLLQGMNLILTPGHIGLMVIGVLLGILVGVLPGLGAPNGVALLLPLTFTMSPDRKSTRLNSSHVKISYA